MLDSAQEAAGLIKGKTRADLDRDRLLNLALIHLLEISSGFQAPAWKPKDV
jgi:hypothetical protein